ncbi:hypothetical protein FOMPIDRAFT_1060100 [Fomitopsis schrenkii]|uniref:Dienelactone hydrolase domain-containing protein n=1 Tax=Fomitopsis schrenkii TaxID=2126942 RepID=S8E7H4_FOMSC|nr:hypothetical protein FOMPIDRAFT_1060100 [Fomitopsis schrenkii]
MAELDQRYCADCFKSVRHDGIPSGSIDRVAGVECYIAEPTGEYAREKAILFLTDAYGHKFLNNQLLADDYARNGFHVVMPDLFPGDAVPSFVPADASISKEEFDIMAWVGRHPPETVEGIVAQVVTALAGRGIARLAGVGFCFGARIAIDLALNGRISVCAVSHPSFWKVPEDIERYYTQADAPLLINSCETDAMFPKEAQEKTDAILGGGRFAPGYARTYWEGCTHGFAVRGDMDDPRVRAGKEGAFRVTVEFLREHL